MDEAPTRLVANPRVIVQTTADGAVLLEMSSGDCFELNQMAAAMWTRLTGGETLPEVVAAIAARFGVNTATVEADARALIVDLVRRGLAMSTPR
jgi:hypothetical protein